MNIVIIDDVAEDGKKLIKSIEEYAKSDFVLINFFSYSSGADFFKEASSLQVDVMFLDIYMEDMSGIEVAKKVRTLGKTFPIVFLTTSQSHAIKSYDFCAIDYIVKPIDQKKTSRVMKRIKNNLEPDFIVVKEGRMPKRVVLSEIIFIDYHNHYVQIHLKNSVVKTYQKFEAFESEMEKYKIFLTCQRCIMVNMNQIEKIEKGYFKLKTGEYISINRNRAKEIKAKYFNYVFGEMENINND